MAQATQPRSRQAATTARTPRAPKTTIGKPRAFNMPFESMNVYIVLAGVAVIALGYFLMSSGDALSGISLNVSPVILLIGYLVVIPMGIMYGAKRKKLAATLQQPEQTQPLQ